MRQEYGNGIYELTEEEKELVEEHKLFYADLFKFGNSILDKCFDDTIKDYELTIYSNFYRIMELLDTLKVMTENSLINSGFIVLRSLIESAVQLCYLISDKNEMQKRATILQMLDIKRTAADGRLYWKRMEEYSCYKDYIEVLKRDKPFSNWYSYCEGKRTTLEDLFGIVGWQDIYTNLYRPLCIETHEISHMETNIVPGRGKFNFKPFRMFENHVLLLNSVLTVMIRVLHSIMDVYGNERLKKEWGVYEIKVTKYVQDNNVISEIEKVFSPLSKWF
ncbi:DUF5677 domain-containing protein [Bariatricus sp. SGI.154]|uniref:DUF5677 domain-containing protein n=1 Tax=Bariatricus sp. SGI.154 TaxID=3420549 RepID=UPI003D08EC85